MAKIIRRFLVEIETEQEEEDTGGILFDKLVRVRGFGNIKVNSYSKDVEFQRTFMEDQRRI